MTRTLNYAFLASLLALGASACGGTSSDEDAGPADAGDETPDAGTMGTDAGGEEDAGAAVDAGPQGCQMGCGIVELSVGILHVCGRRENGEVLCWGRNQESQLGDGRLRHEQCNDPGTEPEDCSSTPVNVRYLDGTRRLVIEDAVGLAVDGFTASCAIREGGDLWCWSSETVPETSGGIQEQREVADQETKFSDVRAAAASGSHLCVISGDDGALSCVGFNGDGQLGTGMFADQQVDPQPVIVDPEAMPPTALTGVIDVDITGGLTCARTASDVYCWGQNRSGQLGDGQLNGHNECLDGVDPYDCSPYPVVVGGEDTTRLGAVDDLDVGSRHACVVQDGKVLCWGDNRTGQCGQDDTQDNVPLPAQVGTFEDAVAVATGGGHSCALHSDGSVSCWGSNIERQLGDGMDSHGATCVSGSSEVDCSRTAVDVLIIDDATEIAANAATTCVIRGGDESVWCWGFNNARQLGDGTRDNSNTPVQVQGLP